jgi:hypothetical protein
MEKELETLLGIQAGQTALLAALIQTHPDHQQLHLATVSLLELLLHGQSGAVQDERTRAIARGYVESLLALRPRSYEDPTKTFRP